MRSKNSICIWIALLSFHLVIGTASALDYCFLWTGSNSSSWWDSENWSLNGAAASVVPTTTSSYYAYAEIGKKTFVNPLVITANSDSDYQTSLVDFHIGGGSEDDPTVVEIEGCNILAQSDFRQNWGSWGAQYSIINMQGGRIETQSGAFMINCDNSGDTGYATFNMTGGYIKVNSNWFDTYQEQYKPGETWVNISGGQIDTRGLFVGERGQSTMTVSGTAVINCDELFIKGWNAGYNGFVSPELIVNSDLPTTTPCITVADALSLHQDAGSNLTQAVGNAKLTINSGYVKVTEGNFRFGNVGQATLTMTGGKLDIATNLDCGIKAANNNDGYSVRAYLSGGELWAEDIIDHGNADIKIFLSNDAVIYLRNPDVVTVQGYIDNHAITALNADENVSLVGGWPATKIIVREDDLYAKNPNYGYGQVNVPIDTELTWESASEAVSHHVYFGTDPCTVRDAVQSSSEYEGSQTTTSLFVLSDQGYLKSSTTYYWRVDEEFSDGEIVQGTVWFFSTPTCNHPVDANGDCNINLYDFAIIADNWLQYDTLGDCLYGTQNLELLAEQWLQPGPFYDPYSLKLVTDWKFDEETGRYAEESISGASCPINKGPHGVMWREGVVGNCLDLDGSSTYLLMSSSYVPDITDEFTVEGWFGVRAWPVHPISSVSDGTNFVSFISCYNSTQGLRFGLNMFGNWGVRIGQNTQWTEYLAPDTVPMMKWTHLAVTYSRNDSIKLYQDGVLVATWSTSDVSFSLPSKTILRIGTDSAITYSFDDSYFPNNLYNGLIDELKIYHRALDENEISEIFSDTRPLMPALEDIEVDSSRYDSDLNRPRYHAIPPANWTNEMHGLVYYGGKYHLFYQANPNGIFIQHQRWGHLVSDDLIHWTSMPPILSPESSTSIDRDGCWAGCVIQQDDRLRLIYTPVDSSVARVGMATMNNDGISATKYSGNPIIGYIGSSSSFEDFRDPFVWQDGSYWYLIIGSGIKAGGGTALLYRSSDLVSWTYLEPIRSDDFSSFWETPVFVPLGDDKYLLYVSKCDPYASSYWIGTWENETFTPDDTEPKHLDPFEEYCSSHNHQIGVSPCIDTEGRIATIHIINDCRTESQRFQAGWAHNFSLPREWFLRNDNTLGQRPHPNLETLRGDHIVSDSGITVDEDGAADLDSICGDLLEIKMTVNLGTASVFGIKLRESPNAEEVTRVEYQKSEGKFVFDLSESSLNTDAFLGTEEGDFSLDSDEDLELQIFIDKSMIEVFVNEKEVFTARIYPTRSDSQLVEFFTDEGEAVISQIDVWEIDP